VDEFRAELDGNLEPGHAARPGAAADAVPRLEDQHGSAGACEELGSGEAGGAGADDNYFISAMCQVRLSFSAMIARLCMALLPLLLAACASTPVAKIDDGAADRAADHAMKMVGKPYRPGGAAASTGFDCSGLVQYSYSQAGVKVARSTEEQLRRSAPVSKSKLRRGDLLFFDQDGKKKSHVGIYLGDGRFVHAPSSGKQVRTDRLDSAYWTRHLSDTRRF
jgi:hypothetical protein